MLLRYIAIILATCILGSCSKEKNTGGYFPLSDHSVWEYNIEYSTSGSARERGKHTRKVVGQTTINGKIYYKIENSYKNVPYVKNYTEYLRVATDGLYSTSPEAGGELLVAPLPLIAGKEWQTGNLTASIKSMGQSVTANKIYKDCAQVTVSAPGNMYNSYYSPGVGLVKSGGTYFTKDNRTIQWENTLQSYTP